ncbi:MAG TPA: hypothetical protein VIM85_01615, partial [Pseudomonadales bacterium]
DIPKKVFDGYEPDLSIKPEPIQNGRQQAHQQRSNSVRAPGAKKPQGSGKARRPRSQNAA